MKLTKGDNTYIKFQVLICKINRENSVSVSNVGGRYLK